LSRFIEEQSLGCESLNGEATLRDDGRFTFAGIA
jgi:hypothetical protein